MKTVLPGMESFKPLSLRAPVGSGSTLFLTSHTARCHDANCQANHHATASQRFTRKLSSNDVRVASQQATKLPGADSGFTPESFSGRALGPVVECPWVESQAAARLELIELASRWTQRYSSAASGSCVHESTNGQAEAGQLPAILLAGHQPEWFHPGVWYKNFVLDNQTRQTPAVGINLLIDQDLVKTNALFVPTEHDGQTTRGRVALDFGGIGIPFQERRIQHSEVISTVPERVQATAASWVGAGLLRRWWPEVVELANDLAGVGYGVAAARHRCELTQGSRTLEVPLSWICETISFAQFVRAILERMEDFVATYNECLAEYRAAYHIVGQQRPMPDLLQFDEWIELPFWLWTHDSPWRQRLVARRVPIGWQCSVLVNGRIAAECWSLDLETPWAVEQLYNLASLQVRLRPRALMTTLYARGVLSDSFLHGIGGALYDQMTDRLAARLWGVQLPDYGIATATFHLSPGSNAPAESERLVHLQQRLRNQYFAPDRLPEFVAANPHWVAQKRELLRRIPPKFARQVWQDQLSQHLQLARQWQAEEIELTRCEIKKTQQSIQQQRWKSDREWSYLLFNEDLPAQLHLAAQKVVGTGPDNLFCE